MDKDEKEDGADRCIKYTCNSGEVCVFTCQSTISIFCFSSLSESNSICF